jgi:hypothetical protein
LELEGDKRPSSFYLGHFSSSKNFDHNTKDASVFHLILGNNHKLSYFPTSTPSRHTSHHQNQSIAICWFLACKYGQPSIGGQLWTCIDFHSNFELTWHHVISPFFLYYTPLYISLIYDVFLNKNLQVFNKT